MNYKAIKQNAGHKNVVKHKTIHLVRMMMMMIGYNIIPKYTCIENAVQRHSAQVPLKRTRVLARHANEI